MKRHKHQRPKPNYILIASIVVIIVVALLLLFSGSKDSTKDEAVKQQADQDQAVLEEEQPVEPELIDTIKEEVVPITSKKIGEEGLCEDYFFEQGDELKILKHSLVVEKIGDGGIRIEVDDEKYLLNEDKTEIVGDDLKVSIAPGKILYFATDDPSNSVMIRVGCDYDDNPNEKYVENRGKRICKEIYEECQDSFNIDLDE